MKRSFLYSLCVHLVLISLLVIHSCGYGSKEEEKKSGSEQGDIRKILPKGTNTSSPLDIELVDAPSPSKTKGEDCPNGRWYGGIGVYEGWNNSRVVDRVIEGYPAYRAGIQKGDVLPQVDNLRGEPGTVVEFNVLRNGKLLSFKLIREKICIE